jgi:hypothetical protein
MFLSGPFAWAPPSAEWRCSQIPSGCIPGGTRRIFEFEKRQEQSDEGGRKILCGGAGKAEGASGAARRVFARSGAKQLGLKEPGT